MFVGVVKNGAAKFTVVRCDVRSRDEIQHGDVVLLDFWKFVSVEKWHFLEEKQVIRNGYGTTNGKSLP